MGADPRLFAQLPHTLAVTEPARARAAATRARSATRTAGRPAGAGHLRPALARSIACSPPSRSRARCSTGSPHFWFEKTAHVVKNHLLDVPDPNVTVARALRAVPVEVVVRGYLTGSLWRDYQKGTHTACTASPFPDGMKKDQAFEAPILTPVHQGRGRRARRADLGEGDPRARAGERRATGQRIREAALALFAEGQKWARDARADPRRHQVRVRQRSATTLYVIDEIHTPDSSRYWVADEYDGALRQGRGPADAGQGEHPAVADPRAGLPAATASRRRFRMRCGSTPAEKYLAAYERIYRARALRWRSGDVHARIEKNLRAKGLLAG